MGLAPAQPDQALLEALSVDAAWQRAKDLELEAKRLRVMLRNAQKAWEDVTAKRGKMEGALWEVIGKYEGHAGDCPAMARLLADLEGVRDKGR